MSVVRLPAILIALFTLPVSVSAGPDASVLLQSGKANEALRLLNSQVQSNPDDARAYNLMCRVYFQLEHWDDAIRAAEKSVALAPREGEYHQWLARADGKKAESAGAVTAISLVRKVKAEFEKAVALDPEGKNLSAYVDLSEFYIEAPYLMGGDKPKARRLADFIANYDPALAHYVRAMLEEKLNARDRAEQEYKEAIQAGGNQARYWVMLASFYRRAGRFNEMEAAITSSLNAPRKDAIPLFEGASVLLNGGRNFQGAIRMLRQYLSGDDPVEDGPAFQAHYFLGLLLEKQGDAKSAVTEYRAALDLASDYHPAQAGLARVNH